MKSNLLADVNFDLGFNLKGLSSIRDGHGVVRAFPLTSSRPKWYLCQWNSRFDLRNGNFTVGEDGYNISDATKSLTVVKSSHEVIFRLNAMKEYLAPRAADEPWPHLLIEQEIKENNRLADFDKFCLHAKFRLLDFENYMRGGEERAHHTAQFVWVITLQDANLASPSYGRFIWVVLCLFDRRYRFVPLAMTQDKALPDGEFIYTFAGEDFMSRPLWDKETIEICFDLMPHVGKILSAAQAQGFMLGTREEDLIASSTNMGFEITGTYACEIGVEDIEIIAERRNS